MFNKEGTDKYKILTKEYLQKEFVNNKLTKYEIAEKLNCGSGTVLYYLHKFGFVMRNKYSKIITYTFLYENYIVNNLSCKEIAKKVGCDSSTIEDYLHKFNILVRKLGGKTKKGSLSISQYMKNQIRNPLYIDKMLKIRKNNNYIQGNYTSFKNGCDIWFQSSYELRVYIKLEQDPTIECYKRCQFSIPYLLDKEIHQYIPDLEIKYLDGKKTILEVKPFSLLRELAGKKEAAENYCRGRGWQYLIWTEKDIIEIPRIKSQLEADNLIEKGK